MKLWKYHRLMRWIKYIFLSDMYRLQIVALEKKIYELEKPMWVSPPTPDQVREVFDLYRAHQRAVYDYWLCLPSDYEFTRYSWTA